MENQSICYKKCNIQKNNIFLTLPTFYQLVCNTVWIEACARQFSPIKQRSLFALASFYILLLCSCSTRSRPKHLIKGLLIITFGETWLKCTKVNPILRLKIRVCHGWSGWNGICPAFVSICQVQKPCINCSVFSSVSTNRSNLYLFVPFSSEKYRNSYFFVSKLHKS